jgi:hypothetical protein
LSDPTNDAGEPAEKRVRKTRVAKTAAPKDSLTIPPPGSRFGRPASGTGSNAGRRAALGALSAAAAAAAGARARHRLPCDPRNACAVGNGNGIDGRQ